VPAAAISPIFATSILAAGCDTRAVPCVVGYWCTGRGTTQSARPLCTCALINCQHLANNGPVPLTATRCHRLGRDSEWQGRFIVTVRAGWLKGVCHGDWRAASRSGLAVRGRGRSCAWPTVRLHVRVPAGGTKLCLLAIPALYLLSVWAYRNAENQRLPPVAGLAILLNGQNVRSDRQSGRADLRSERIVTDLA
jgi:hypothetical protein